MIPPTMNVLYLDILCWNIPTLGCVDSFDEPPVSIAIIQYEKLIAPYNRKLAFHGGNKPMEGICIGFIF
jgi:hypothetical protein